MIQNGFVILKLKLEDMLNCELSLCSAAEPRQGYFHQSAAVL